MAQVIEVKAAPVAEIKSGYLTTEFLGKTLVQLLTLIAMFVPEAKIDPATGLAIVAALETAYNLGRSIIKSFHERAKSPTVVVEKVA